MKEFIRKQFPFLKNIFVLTLIPLFFTGLFALVYSKTYVEEIPLAVLDLDQSQVSRTLVQSFEDSVGFSIAFYANSEGQIQEAMLNGKIHGALILPEGFEADLSRQQSPRVLVFIDGTNIFVGNSAYAYAANIIGTVNAGIQISVLDAGGMVPYVAEQTVKTLSFTERVLYVPQMGNFVYAFSGFLGIFLQQTYISVLAPILLREKRRLKAFPPEAGQRKLAAARVAKESFVYGLFTFIPLIGCLLLAHFVGGYPLNGSLFLTLTLHMVFLLDLTAITIFIAVFFVDTSNCIQFIMLLSIPSFLTSGYIWPGFAMPPYFEMLVKAMWPLHYFVLPLRDTMLKGTGFGEAMPYLAGGILFAALWFPIALLAFRQNIRTMRQAETESFCENMETKNFHLEANRD